MIVNMEVTSPHLEALQAITGKTPGEKHKAINKIATQAAERIQGGKNFIQVISSFNVPEALEPLFRIKVANILKHPEEVIVALKNEDSVVTYQALKARWFFEGTQEHIFNVDYFEENVFPHISFRTRSRVIKNMALRLKVTSVAENFFKVISKKYGSDKAMPLLLACSENFILPAITERKLILPCKLLSQIYRKYPAVVIEYLKKSGDKFNISIFDYQEFLPKMVDEHLEAFIEIYEMHMPWSKLGRERTKVLLRSNAQKLLDDPELYFRILPKKVVAEKLTKEQFQRMFRKLLPDDVDRFDLDGLEKYLKHYEKSEKLRLVLDGFEEKYGESLLKRKEKIGPRLMRMLPAEERVEQARRKLEEENEWYVSDHDKSWRCYLPTVESVPAIKDQISKTPDSCNRSKLFKQLVFTCKVNEDRDALLEVLKYFVENHGNEEKKVRYDFLGRVMGSFDLQSLDAEFWTILNDCLKKGHAEDDFRASAKVIKTLLQKVIYYNCSNDLPIEKEIEWATELAMNGWVEEWSIFKKHLKFEEKCLLMTLNTIPRTYPDEHEIWKEDGLQAVKNLIRYIYEFNVRNRKLNNTIPRMSLEDHPWLREKCLAILNDQNDGSNETHNEMVALLKANEKDLYHLWLKDTKPISDYLPEDIINILKKEPQKVLDDWKEYLRNTQKSMPSKKANTFMRRSRWYQDLPMKFVDQCLLDLKDTKDRSTFMTLAILLDGQSFTKVIEPYLLTASEDEDTSKNSSAAYRIMRTISQSICLVDPTVCLNILSRFRSGEFLKLAISSFTSVSFRVPLSKLVPVAKSLLTADVSVTKRVIRLVHMLASLGEKRVFLADLWKTEKHGSIREAVFNRILDVFEETPESQTWRMVDDCIKEVSIDDEDGIRERLLVLESIPDEYVTNYIKLVFNKISALENNGFDPEKSGHMEYVLLNNISPSICTQLPEEYCEELIRKYLFRTDCKSDLAYAGMDFAMRSYIPSAGDKLKMRLNFLAEHMKECVKKDWDVPHQNDRRYYPMNTLLNSFILSVSEKVDKEGMDSYIFEVLLDTLISGVTPLEIPVSYSLLIFCIEYKKAESPEDFGFRVAHKIPQLTEMFSPEYVMFLADHLDDFLSSRMRNDLLYSTIEGLIEVGTAQTCMIAASILSRRKWFHEERFRALHDKVNKVQVRDYPALSCVFYEDKISVTENALYELESGKGQGRRVNKRFCRRRCRRGSSASNIFEP